MKSDRTRYMMELQARLKEAGYTPRIIEHDDVQINVQLVLKDLLDVQSDPFQLPALDEVL